jgi:hypothetical protein
MTNTIQESDIIDLIILDESAQGDDLNDLSNLLDLSDTNTNIDVDLTNLF